MENKPRHYALIWFDQTLRVIGTITLIYIGVLGFKQFILGKTAIMLGDVESFDSSGATFKPVNKTRN